MCIIRGQSADKNYETVDNSASSAQQYIPQDVINKIKSTLSSQYTVLNMDDNNHPATGQVSIHVGSTAPTYKAAGYNFYVSDSGSSIEIMTHDDVNMSLTGSPPYPEDQAIR